MKHFAVSVLLVTFVATNLASDLIPNCPDPSDGSILAKGLDGISDALVDAGKDLPKVGIIFKFISIFLTSLGGFDDNLSIIIKEMVAYVNCEIALAEERQNSQRMVNDLKSYSIFFQAISVGSPTPKEYIELLYTFFTITVEPEQFINPAELTSNVEFLKYAIAVHLGAGLELMSACVKFNDSQCLEFRDKWNYFYALYMPYAESVVAKAVDWRLKFVKLTCTPGENSCFCGCQPRQCCPICYCKDIGYYIDSFVSTKKLHNTFEDCNQEEDFCSKSCSLVKEYDEYRAQIQARMTKNFAQPISDWKKWYNQINTACPMTVPHGKIILPKNWDTATAGMKRQLICDSGTTLNVTCFWPNWSPKLPSCKQKFTLKAGRSHASLDS